MYCLIKTEFRSQEALLCALVETKNRNGKFWSPGQIKICEEPQPLVGYEGSFRKEKAHIIIPRTFVGGSANDLGFIRNEAGVYEAIISEYDKSFYNESWLCQLKQNYSYHAIKLQQEQKGRKVTRERLDNGKQRVTVSNIR